MYTDSCGRRSTALLTYIVACTDALVLMGACVCCVATCTPVVSTTLPNNDSVRRGPKNSHPLTSDCCAPTSCVPRAFVALSLRLHWPTVHRAYLYIAPASGLIVVSPSHTDCAVIALRARLSRLQCRTSRLNLLHVGAPRVYFAHAYLEPSARLCHAYPSRRSR